MKIYIGADHRGFRHKQSLVEHLKRAGYDVEDEGNKALDPDDDFPEFAGRVVTAVKTSKDNDPRGILLCGSGQGMAIAANRHKNIYACVAWDKQSARESRHDDNTNILCLPASSLKTDEINQITETWLDTPFAAAARFVRRLKKIDE